jgi:hypothetical protein
MLQASAMDSFQCIITTTTAPPKDIPLVDYGLADAHDYANAETESVAFDGRFIIINL